MGDLVGMDMAGDSADHLPAIRAAHISFLGRYYRWPKSKYPRLTYKEAAAITQAGLHVVALWEWSNDISNFSFHNGLDQGTSAYKQAMDAHQPAGSPIYFAVDEDFSASQISGPVLDYFRGVAQGFKVMGSGAPAYLIGVYGSGRTCSWLLDHAAVTRTWLACSVKWAGYEEFEPKADIAQGLKDLHIGGLTPGARGDYDSDIGRSAYGGFQVLKP